VAELEWSQPGPRPGRLWAGVLRTYLEGCKPKLILFGIPLWFIVLELPLTRWALIPQVLLATVLLAGFPEDILGLRVTVGLVLLTVAVQVLPYPDVQPFDARWAFASVTMRWALLRMPLALIVTESGLLAWAYWYNRRRAARQAPSPRVPESR
jgi:hypothetical protein